MKKILITGGSGYLGVNLALKLKKKYKILLGSRNNKNNFIAERITKCDSVPLDVSNINSVKDVVSYFKPNIIIHAAATKFVDRSEKYPLECVDINILGSSNIARVAIERKVENVIGISTDKASSPIKNIYGLTKATMEKIFISLNSTCKTTKFSCVRYGNVAWSTGSVLPIWNDMFKKNKKIYTTGPYMRRFFFSISDAVKLVENSLKNLNIISGKILSVEMKSCQIIDLIKCWINLYGGKYVITESREGERIDENLIGENELEFTSIINFNKKKHFLIDYKKKQKKPLKEIVSSFNSPRLTNHEIKKIIRYREKFENI